MHSWEPSQQVTRTQVSNTEQQYSLCITFSFSITLHLRRTLSILSALSAMSKMNNTESWISMLHGGTRVYIFMFMIFGRCTLSSTWGLTWTLPTERENVGGGGPALRSFVEAWEPHSSQRPGFIVGYRASNVSGVCRMLCLHLMERLRWVWGL